jgi:hypothetical protein
MDILNQTSLILNSDHSLTPRLRKVLAELCKLPEYSEWEQVGQFTGKRFRLPRRFISAEPKERRLLESFKLVYDDVLQVKVNHFDGLIFLTDGLFVPGDFRVYPFFDESDRLMEAMANSAWQSWPTVVIDPAAGCGHSPLRAVDCRRIALDISVRAISFANVNSLLNEQPLTVLAVNDIERGLPLFGRYGERVLFLINMPFALEPISGTLVRTAAGGENGYEKTLSALRAVHRYASESPEDDIRALVLAYSVGKQDEDKWLVPEEAKALFGDEAVRWQILTEERLWRINGQKEQPNPMPLASLRLKADCKYYVRDPKMREPLRDGYARKERELRSRGFDALAYGVLCIEAGRGQREE